MPSTSDIDVERGLETEEEMAEVEVSANHHSDMLSTSDIDVERGLEMEEEMPELEAPLHPGAKLTLKVALLLILAFVLNHRISNEALED